MSLEVSAVRPGTGRGERGRPAGQTSIHTPCLALPRVGCRGGAVIIMYLHCHSDAVVTSQYMDWRMRVVFRTLSLYMLDAKS